ncbi:glycosyltransferase family 2 protein [Agreia pratensis]|nr:glycosyltransferase family 2 protein [Agreia pratensis]
MTIMVRDEADIIGAMIDYHLSQGVDTIIVTDNGSVDGTTQILESFSERGLVDLRHDPRHRKQQSEVVTQMARDAYTTYAADWVINADADEFFVPLDRTLSLHDIFEAIPKSLQSFQVPVVNLTGPPALKGSGLQRLVYRDQRDSKALSDIGIRAHPTPDAIHVGDPDISVIQGNHLVSLESKGSPDPGLGLEVMHLPWRSWSQYKHKVEVSGRAYTSNPELSPSPNHHGMRDYARLKAGVLLPFYLVRHPTSEDLNTGVAKGDLVVDTFLSDRLNSPVKDVAFDEEVIAAHVEYAGTLRADSDARVERAREPLVREIGSLKTELVVREERFNQMNDDLKATRDELLDCRSRSASRKAELEEQLALLRRENEAFRDRRIVRFVDAFGRMLARGKSS